jgi:hypothetical protein
MSLSYLISFGKYNSSYVNEEVYTQTQRENRRGRAKLKMVVYYEMRENL